MIPEPRLTTHWLRQWRQINDMLVADEVVLDAWRDAMEALQVAADKAEAVGSIEPESEQLALDRHGRLDLLIRERLPDLADFFGNYLFDWLCLYSAIATGMPWPRYQDFPLRAERPAVGSPLRVLASGAVIGAEGADMRHFQELRDYYRSLGPERRRGRPRGRAKAPTSGRAGLDPAKAALAAQMADDGAGWRNIAEAVGVVFNRYDPKAVNRARAAVGRLVERGKLNRCNP